MTKRIPLDALIRRVWRMAEQMFDRQGDVDPIWLIETASGEQHTIVTPIIAPSPLAAATEKDRTTAKMREYFAENDVVRYAFAMEAWTLTGPERKQVPTEEQAALEYAAMGYTLAHHPDRREAVIIEADDGTEVLTAFRDIVRPAHGKPYLGKLGAIERRRSLYGRWIGLLPSKEHAQALRPEAERLILSVHRWLTEREEAEGLTIEQFSGGRVYPRWMSKLGIPRCRHGPSGGSSISRTDAEVADEQYRTRVCRYKPAPGRGAR